MTQQTRAPTSDIATGGTVARSSGTTNYTLVATYPNTADPLTSYVALGTTANSFFVCGFSNFTVPAGATINWVEVQYYDEEPSNGANTSDGRIRVNATYYNSGTTHNPSTTTTSRTKRFTTNPATAAAWTVAAVNNDGGTGLNAFGVIGPDSNPVHRVGAIQLVVDFNDPSASISVTEDGDSASGNVNEAASLSTTEAADDADANIDEASKKGFLTPFPFATVHGNVPAVGITLDADEQSDTASFVVPYLLSLETTEASDEFSGNADKVRGFLTPFPFYTIQSNTANVTNIALAATEATDTAEVTVTENASLAASEQADTAEFTVTDNAALSATEDADTGSFDVTENASLDATEAGDTAEAYLFKQVDLALDVTEEGDSSNFQLVEENTASIDVTEAADEASATVLYAAKGFRAIYPFYAPSSNADQQAFQLDSTEQPDTSSIYVDDVPVTLDATESGDTAFIDMAGWQGFRTPFPFPFPQAVDRSNRLLAVESSDTAEFTLAHYGIKLEATEDPDTTYDTLAFALTEVSDTASGYVGIDNPVVMFAVEDGDSSEFTLQDNAYLSATEQADESSITLTLDFALAATEDGDVMSQASVVLVDLADVIVSATEQEDTLSATVDDTLVLGATEGSDTADATVSYNEASLGATEAADTFSGEFTFVSENQATLNVTESADSGSADVQEMAYFAVTEAADTGIFTVTLPLNLITTENPDVAALIVTNHTTISTTESSDRGYGFIYVGELTTRQRVRVE